VFFNHCVDSYHAIASYVRNRPVGVGHPLCEASIAASVSVTSEVSRQPELRAEGGLRPSGDCRGILLGLRRSLRRTGVRAV